MAKHAPVDEPEMRVAFQSLVLSGIWLLIMAACAKNIYHRAGIWRARAISHFDVVGNQSEGAPKYRREETFPELQP